MPAVSAQHPIAFFCAEFGIQSDLPIYAGGLGVLAGDILKESARQKIPMVAVGLLYRGEGAIQHITVDGQQVELDLEFDPLSAGLEHVYLDDMPLFIQVHLTQVDVWVRCWKKTIGETVTLYLLDTDTDQNQIQERGIAHALYAGTEEELIKQQLILGIGGVKLLHQLGIHPSLYHVNEGRPAFLHWQLIRRYMDEHGVSYDNASDWAKQKTVYTNHTLVEAGNQSYTSELLKVYGKYYADKMGITVERLLEPGIEAGADRFSITHYALSTSSKASAVSQLHYSFCQQSWPEYNWSAVTNGVYLPYWQDQRFSSEGLSASSVDTTLSEAIWQNHADCKRQLAEYVQKRTGFTYDPNRLVISWARRMAGYKQSDALFNDMERLVKIVKDADRPVQILIAGKAHVFDTAAKQTIERIIRFMKEELSGHALFVPNLNMELDQMLVRGSDVWLNTPEYGKEACGTSGMKAISNGVLQCTVADGWAAEVNWDGTGWQLDHTNLTESLYSLIENEIVPTFYTRDEAGIPQTWVEKMRRSISLAERFSAQRMMNEYKTEFYFKD
jgi:alpha-glucan phosphorylase-like protein